MALAFAEGFEIYSKAAFDEMMKQPVLPLPSMLPSLPPRVTDPPFDYYDREQSADRWLRDYIVDPRIEFKPIEIRDEDEGPLAPILARFTYKKGWRFKSYTRCRGPYAEVVLKISITTDCADRPGEVIELSGTYTVDGLVAKSYDERRWLLWLRERIIEAEKHEVDEFFQIGGVKIFDPH